MDKTRQISLTNLLTVFAHLLDTSSYPSPYQALKTAYLSFHMGKALGFSPKELDELLIAGLLHDVGLLPEETEILGGFSQSTFSTYMRHSILAYIVFKKSNFFMNLLENVPRVVLYHPVEWIDFQRLNENHPLMRLIKRTGEEVPLSSFIIHFAGELVHYIVGPYPSLLEQKKIIIEKAEEIGRFSAPPEIKEVFLDIAKVEALWLSLCSPFLPHLVRKLSSFFITEEELVSLARLFCDLVNLKNPITAVHSLGVSSVAEALGKFFKLQPNQFLRLKIAGLLHDIGKLLMPGEIFEKGNINRKRNGAH